MDAHPHISPEQQRRAWHLVTAWVFGAPVLGEICALPEHEALSVIVQARLEAHLLHALTRFQGEHPDGAPLRKLLQKRCFYMAARNFERDRHAREICALFQEEGIPVMILKGSALRARYPELAGRPQCDTDLMIPGPHLTRADEIVRASGYHVDETRLSREQYLEQHFDLRYLREDDALELHWAMSNESRPGAVERAWERADEVAWGGITVKAPALADQVVFHQVHIARHEFYGALRWYADMYFELGKWPHLEAHPEEVVADWPERYQSASAIVAAAYGRALDPWEASAASRETSLDRRLLQSIASHHLQGRDWWPIPHWYYDPGFARWLNHESRHLSVSVLGAICSRLLLRLRIALGLADMPPDI